MSTPTTQKLKSYKELYPLEITELSDEALPQLRKLAEAATFGRWRWFGDTDSKQIYLATQHAGRVFVMDFVRYGMQSAQPRFQDPEQHLMFKAHDLVEYEVCPDAGADRKDKRVYRATIGRINNPDAIYIEEFSPYTAIQLLDKIEALQQKVRSLEAAKPEHPSSATPTTDAE